MTSDANTINSLDATLAPRHRGLIGRLESVFHALKIHTSAQWVTRTRYRQYQASFSEVQRFCMFVGYPRSAHSLIGSLLSAHPDAVISHELDLLRYVKHNYSREQLYTLIIERDKWFSKRGRNWTGYDYDVPGQYQGRFKTLKLIGDKKGMMTAYRIQQDPSLITKLHDIVQHPVTWIHVVRHPWDNITTMCRKSGYPSLHDAMNRYADLCAGVKITEQRLAELSGEKDRSAKNDEHGQESGHRFITRYAEEFNTNTKAELVAYCESLDLEPHQDFIDACASVVFQSPKQTRHDMEWSTDNLKQLARLCETYPWLNRYCDEIQGVLS